MDMALVVSGVQRDDAIRNVLLRPFADSSLLEIALEKLSWLDAPCRKYVVCAGKETRHVAGKFAGLTSLKSTAESVAKGAPADQEFVWLRNLPETRFLIIDPCFPLVSAETWWEAIEHFDAHGGAGLVSVARLEGRFYSTLGRPLLPDEESPGAMLLENSAFKIVSREAIFSENRPWLRAEGAPLTFELPTTVRWCVAERDDLSAVEAVYSMSQLGLYA